MKFNLKTILLSLLLAYPAVSNAQVIISLLFGEKLNSEKIEFGLEGGFNRSYFRDVPEANGLNNFNLGFYFHFLIKNNAYLATGVMVKSSVGATGMPTYKIGDEDFDNLFEDGTRTTKINYFHVPVLWHQRFNNRWYIEIGPMLGLRSKAKDIFETDVLEGDLKYTLDVRDRYKRFDAGLVGGAGYKFRKRIKSMAAGVNYYYGLMNVSTQSGTKIRNSSIYLYLKIPIGAGSKPGEES
ncbi:MAG: PorT family protein [Cytophagales bacterium]|nr:PorT family protein [Cytophagales bacterium]